MGLQRFEHNLATEQQHRKARALLIAFWPLVRQAQVLEDWGVIERGLPAWEGWELLPEP